jgi:tungstate transport system ATP-binding protein
MNKGTILLEATALNVSRGGVEVLVVPDFVLHENEVLALIGPNGAGKSTFLLALARLLPVAAGDIRFRGASVIPERALFPYRRSLAMVFQEPLLFDATVFDNVAAGLKIRGLPAREVRQRVTEILERFGMLPFAGRSARKLSGGEAQRTSLARAFAIRPEVIFLDEPFSFLDPPTRQSLIEDLALILAETSTAAVLSTHDHLEALRLSDRMVVMNRGRIVQSGPPAEVMNRPVDEFVASFVGMENILTGRVSRSEEGMLSLAVADQGIEIPGNGQQGDLAVFCIHPEHVTVSTLDPGGGSSARNIFPARIIRITPAGAYHKVLLDCGFTLMAYLTNHSLGSLGLTEGKRVFASFKATSVHLIKVEK